MFFNPPKQPPICAHRGARGYICTRAEGHTGYHEAVRHDGWVVANWPQRSDQLQALYDAITRTAYGPAADAMTIAEAWWRTTGDLRAPMPHIPGR